MTIYLGIPGMSTSDIVRFSFNGDATVGNYNSRDFVNVSPQVDYTIKDAIYLSAQGASSTGQYYEIHVKNIVASKKLISWTGTIEGGNSMPVSVKGAGVWTNTSNAITSWRLFSNATTNFNAGTNVRVVCSKD